MIFKRVGYEWALMRVELWSSGKEGGQE
jgi:hypothetical protein